PFPVPCSRQHHSPMVKKKPDSVAPAADPETQRELLRSMLLQRRFEERCAEAYALGKIGGFCHLYIGQEACGTGAISVLRPDDYIITTYRDHGQALARGIAPRSILAELFGRSAGHVPIATGVAFAIKYRGGDQVCVCFMGESVVNTGAFHEALNMAALWKL